MMGFVPLPMIVRRSTRTLLKLVAAEGRLMMRGEERKVLRQVDKYLFTRCRPGGSSLFYTNQDNGGWQRIRSPSRATVWARAYRLREKGARAVCLMGGRRGLPRLGVLSTVHSKSERGHSLITLLFYSRYM